MSLLDTVKDKLNVQMASVQSDVGSFLMQKAKILGLPPTAQKQTLLNSNASIQDRATAAIGKGTALKTQLDNFSPMDFAAYAKIPQMARDAEGLVNDLGSLHTDMAAHISAVTQAASGTGGNGAAPLVPGQSGGGLAAKVAAAVLVGGAAWGLWKKWGKRAAPLILLIAAQGCGVYLVHGKTINFVGLQSGQVGLLCHPGGTQHGWNWRY